MAGARPAASTSPRASRLVDHPGTVYLREVDLLPHLDGWLTGLFHPATLDVTLDALIAASQDASGTAEACARSSGRWPTASASSPATERRWTPEQFNFLEVWTSRSAPRRPLVRTAPTRREPLGAHHHHRPDRPAPSRHLPGATRAGAVGASWADAFAVRRTVRPCCARGPPYGSATGREGAAPRRRGGGRSWRDREGEDRGAHPLVQVEPDRAAHTSLAGGRSARGWCLPKSSGPAPLHQAMTSGNAGHLRVRGA